MRRFIGEYLAAWVRHISSHRRLALAVLGLLCVAAGAVSGLWGGINSDLGTLIKPSQDNAWYRQNEAFKAKFPLLQGTAVVVVSGSDALDVQETARQLARALDAVDEFEDVFAPGVSAFIAQNKALFLELGDLEKWLLGVRYNYGPALRLAEEATVGNAIVVLADQASSAQGNPLPETLLSLAEGLVREPAAITMRLYPRLLDRDAARHYELIIVKGRQQHAASLPNAEIVQRIRDAAATVPLGGDTQIRLTGEVPLAHEEISAAMRGVGFAGLVSLLLLALILGVGVRAPRIIIAIFCMLGAGVLLTSAYATLVVGAYNTLALIFVVMFFGLGVDFAVHYALRMREVGSAQQAARDTGPAIALCMVTSAIAFLSFAPTAYRGLAELGLISAGGMVIAFILTLTLLPLLIRDSAARASGIALSFPELPARRVIAGFVGLALGAGFVAHDLRFDYSVLAMRDAQSEAMRTLVELQQEGHATDYSISILAADAAAAAALKTRLTAAPGVGTVATPADYVPGNQQEKAARLREVRGYFANIGPVLRGEAGIDIADAAAYFAETPMRIAQTEQPLLDGVARILRDAPQSLHGLDDGLARALRDELDALDHLLSAAPFDLAQVPEQFRARLISADGEHLVTVQPDQPLTSRAATQAFVQRIMALAPNVAGRSVVEWGVGGVVVDAFAFALGLSLALIFGVLVVYFRGVLLPSVVMTPILLTILFTLAICQLSPLTINMANILVFPLIVGLGVDTGIHITHRFLHDASVDEVLHSSTARAVIISGLTTIGTFFSLSFSPHKGAASVGLLLTVAVSIMLVVSFVLLPALLRRIKSQG